VKVFPSCVSIIPDNGNAVSKTVVIDAATNTEAALFNNDSDPGDGTAADPGASYWTTQYLSGKVAGNTDGIYGGQGGSSGSSSASTASGTTGNTAGSTATTPTSTPPSTTPETSVQRKLDALIAAQQQQLQQLQALQKQLVGKR